jgi:sporulation protein YlmC with PRC-barrel domain
MKLDNEISSLISSEKVAGTEVYNNAGEMLGSIAEIMIDKKTGVAQYAIMSFGGFLGMGSNYHPLPWSLLKYDSDKGGYVVNLDKSQLEGAPVYDATMSPEWDQAYGNSIFTYYGLPYL